MDYRFLIGEYVTLVNPRDKADERESWTVHLRTVDEGVTKYIVSTGVGLRLGKARTVVEEELAPAMTEHAHVVTKSRDCDGTYVGEITEFPNEDERCSQFGDLRFRERLMDSIVTLHGHGTLTVTPEGMSWYENTDEGYRRAEVTWCENDCRDETRQWDLTAEAAGY